MEWEAHDGKVPKEWIREDGLIEWSYVAQWIEENLADMEIDTAREWLEDHAEIIQWSQFYKWAEEVEGKPGYEWLDGVFEAWDKKEKKLDWDEVAKHIDSKKDDIEAEDAVEWFVKNADMIDMEEM